MWKVTFRMDHVSVCVQAKEPWEMDAGQKLEQSRYLKANGTKFFQVAVYHPVLSTCLVSHVIPPSLPHSVAPPTPGSSL